MQVTSWYKLNGKFFLETENHLSINNRSFRYGDGFFETMKIVDCKILLKDLHFERIEKSLQLLKLQFPKLFSLKKIRARNYYNS